MNIKNDYPKHRGQITSLPTGNYRTKQEIFRKQPILFTIKFFKGNPWNYPGK